MKSPHPRPLSVVLSALVLSLSFAALAPAAVGAACAPQDVVCLTRPVPACSSSLSDCVDRTLDHAVGGAVLDCPPETPCAPLGYGTPGEETCVWGNMNWCFRPESVSPIPADGSEVWCYEGRDAVAHVSAFTSTVPDSVAASLGSRWVATWHTKYDSQVTGVGTLAFQKVPGTSSPTLYRSVGPLFATGGPVGDCHDLSIDAPGPCTFHCSAKFLRYI